MSIAFFDLSVQSGWSMELPTTGNTSFVTPATRASRNAGGQSTNDATVMRKFPSGRCIASPVGVRGSPSTTALTGSHIVIRSMYGRNVSVVGRCSGVNNPITYELHADHTTILIFLE